MRRSGILSSLLVVALAACGGVHYGFVGGGLPAHIRTMAVLPFDNQTSSPDLQRELFETMRRGLQQKLGVRDASQDRADAIVRGVIQSYDVDVPVAFSSDPNQTPSARRRLQLVIDVEIVDQSTGKILFGRKGLREEGDYAEGAEPVGRRQAIDRLVNDIIEGAQSQW